MSSDVIRCHSHALWHTDYIIDYHTANMAEIPTKFRPAVLSPFPWPHIRQHPQLRPNVRWACDPYWPTPVASWCIHLMTLTQLFLIHSRFNSHPRWSMYGISTYIYPINDPNVGKYTIHGSSGHQLWILARQNGHIVFFFQENLDEMSMKGTTRIHKVPLASFFRATRWS